MGRQGVQPLFEGITAEILSAIGGGTDEYRMPWHTSDVAGLPSNAISGRPYRGINILLLWAVARQRGFAASSWATYRQWTEAGGRVRRGEKGCTVLLWKVAPDLSEDEAARESAAKPARMLARAFTVFNVSQVDDLETVQSARPSPARHMNADAFFAPFSHIVDHGGYKACYDRTRDLVSLPSFSSFVSAEAYYSVLAHELIHWTGAEHRLNRDLSGRFGGEAYAMEELIAELGAAFVAGHLELASSPRRDHAPYIASWLKVLRDDPRAIISAAAKAQSAADYLITYAASGAEGAHAVRA